VADVRTQQKSFGGGELTPEFYGQLDNATFQMGLALCRNFITAPHGPAFNRSGTAYVNSVKTPAKRTKLIPFTYSTTQTMVLEFGDGYIRFHTMGATLLNGGVPYEIASPYAEADLFDIHYVQSADVLTLVHPNYTVRELRRGGALSWTLTAVVFVSAMTAPTGVTATPTYVSGTAVNKTYVVTSVGADGIDESLPSSGATASNNLGAPGAYNTIAWATTGAARYNVYALDNGLYGFVGQTTGLSLIDDNITADLGQTPPEANNPFVGTSNYPAAVSYFEQRRAFGGTLNKPQNLWLTRSGTESNLQASIPVRDDDAISFRVAAREANTIRHIVSLTDMILLTSSAEWRVTSTAGALTPTTLSVKPQSYIGASNVQPSVVNNTLIFCAARGGHVRELGFTERGAVVTGDLSLRAPHLFDGSTIVDMAFAKAPQPVVWFVSSNGHLLGLTYVPEEEVGAWHWHDTDGFFESVCTVAEGEEDAVYVVVRRTVNGASVRYIERFASRRFVDLADAFFVDAGVQYVGAPITTINSGLAHLEGKVVSILGDGAVRPQRTVTGGTVTLDHSASKISIGLPIVAQLQTLPSAFDTQGMGQGRPKNVNAVWLRTYRSGGIFAGPALDKMTEAKIRTTEAFGSPPNLKSDEIKIVITPAWMSGGQVFVEQRQPLPLTLVSLSLQESIGG
jgi:hypothetical protein